MMDTTPSIITSPVAAFDLEQDEEQNAIQEALGELEAGKGRPFPEFAAEFSARFEALLIPS